MISKKILALVLALSVIVCALPAFSVSAAEEAWPDVEETLVNPEAWFNNGLSICVADGSDGLKAAITNGMASSYAMKVSGTVTFGTETITLNNYIIRSSSPSKQALTGWGGEFTANDPTFLERLKASDAKGLERDDNGAVITATSGEDGKATIRNFVRYMLTAKGIDYSELTNDQLQASVLNADSAEITFHPVVSTLLEKYPEGSLFLPTSEEYAKHGLRSDWKSSTYGMYTPTVTGSCGEGPYAVYQLKEAGEYKVWLLKRDRNENTATRDVYIDVNGQTLAFTNVEGATSALAYYMAPEDNGATLSVEAGEKLLVRINGKTNVYAGSYGLLLVPADAADDVTITGNVEEKSDAMFAAVVNMVSGKYKNITPNKATATVKVNGTELTVKDGEAETYYPNVELVNDYGDYIDGVTILDTIVAADKAGLELPFKLATGDVVVGDTVTPVTYDTTVASGKPWPTHTNGTADLWGKLEVYCTNSTTPYSMTIAAPKAGNYWMFAKGYGWDEKRWLNISVNGTAVEEAAGDTRFFDSVKTYALTVTQSPVALNEGANTISIATSGNFIRMAYLGFVEAETREAAMEIINEITASKEAFNEYYAVTGSIYSAGKITNYDGAFFVNGKCYADDLQATLVPNGAVVETKGVDKTNFAPVKIGTITGFGTRYNTDILFNEEGSYWGKFKVSSQTFPYGEAGARDAFAGCYLNGYVNVIVDCAGQKLNNGTAINTTGDDTIVKIYIHDIPIKFSATNGANTELYFEADPEGTNGWNSNMITANVDGQGNKTYHGNYLKTGITMGQVYDTSNLYITNSTSNAAAKINAVKGDNGVYTLTCNKSMPVYMVRVTKVDGVVTNIANESFFIDFMNEAGKTITVGENETVYLWKGTSVLTGTDTMYPLCAPLTR